MNLEYIETFLTIYKYGSISKASEHLYISQSSVSNRLMKLENHLGTKLIIREKGAQYITLTTAGNQFLLIAEQMSALWRESEVLKDTTIKETVNIASVDAIHNYTFLPLYKEVLNENNYDLSLNIFHSKEIHGLVENRTADIGYVYSTYKYPHIKTKPVFRELMYLVCHKNSPYYENISINDLPTEEEIYLNWNDRYETWHNLHLTSTKDAHVTVNTGSMLINYLTNKSRWAIAPMSVINQFISDEDIVYYALKETPPPIVCYELTNQYPTPNQINKINIVTKLVEEYILKSNTICVFEDWMYEHLNI